MTDMQESDGISLNARAQEPQTSDNISERANRQRESERRRALALAGSALSQLPIWGILPSPLMRRLPNSHRFRHELRCTTAVLL
jgi:hypothetical protein